IPEQHSDLPVGILPAGVGDESERIRGRDVTQSERDRVGTGVSLSSGASPVTMLEEPQRLTMSDVFSLFGRHAEDTRWVASAASRIPRNTWRSSPTSCSARAPASQTAARGGFRRRRAGAGVTNQPRSRHEPSESKARPRYKTHTRAAPS